MRTAGGAILEGLCAAWKQPRYHQSKAGKGRSMLASNMRPLDEESEPAAAYVTYTIH
jgi:hypothetical protein